MQSDRVRIAVIKALGVLGGVDTIDRLKDEIVGRVNSDVEEAADAAIKSIHAGLPKDQVGGLSVANDHLQGGGLSIPDKD